MDLRANIEEPLLLYPGERVLVPTGLYISLPPHLEGQIRPRSGIAFRFGVTVLNSPGTIDSSYRGEVKVLLVNLSKQIFSIQDGDRIAQLVICPISRVEWQVVQELDETTRGQGGFGSTGIQ
ncbi:deoxyuridine 5'-triphosphate nucleotidohydrolase [Golden Marseillevirus]|uniref:dUTPase n=1 Tax=Golden Marseillevirus TaxID=1720526 RepID=UPI000877A99E|nr:dUTPase [Golden Marseillevirus]ALX27667.1 deoxyuridine 5'-triphosphate nucleotidohydrolase [Golden Marseillevirus]